MTNRLLQISETAMAMAVVGIVFMLIVPLPAWFLDMLLVLNITGSLITILIAMSVSEPLEFSVFPTMLLIATLFRLSLDVSATRMILLYGSVKDPVTQAPVGAGHLIPAFGQVVVGGNMLVGLMMFIILVIIQIMVITKGAERVAQVAARFTLDKMPLEQMAIDTDLNSGAITTEVARERRARVQKQSDFYGAMDGAGKFINGDAIAAIVIMGVNIVGGLVMGIVFNGMSAWDALNTFALLSIGNGLITTVPAFLMSTAMGIIVTRAASQSNLGVDLMRQLAAQPQALKNAAKLLFILGLLGFSGIFPFPPTPFLLLGGLLLMCVKGLEHEGEAAVAAVEEKKEEVVQTRRKEPEMVTTIMGVDPLALEVGRGLLSLVDPGQGAKLLERVTSVRRHLALEMGIVVPGVRFRDNLQLSPNAYLIRVRNLEVARGEVFPLQFLAIGPEERLKNLRGTRTLDPTYGMPGMWISPEQRGDAERQGCMLFDPVSVMATQLTEVVRQHAATLLGRQDVQALIDTVRKAYPVVVKEATAELSLGEIQKVLQNLVSERVSIRDLVMILECLADHVGVTKDPELLTEFVRVRLCSTICADYVNNEGSLQVLTLDPDLERALRGPVDPHLGHELLAAVGREVEAMQERGLQPIMLTTPDVRPQLRRLTARVFPNLVVLSWNEVAPKVQVVSLAMASL